MSEQGQDTESASLPDQETRLCDHLLAVGALDVPSLARAQALREAPGDGDPVPRRLHGLLTQLGIVSERDMATALSAVCGLPLVRLADYGDEPPLGEQLSPKFLRKAGALPIRETDDGLVVAMIDPLDDFLMQALHLAAGKAIEPVVAIPSELEEAFQRLFSDGRTELAEIVGEDGDGAAPDDEDAERLKDLASGAPVVRLVSLLIARAVEAKASDIHIEPSGHRLRVRYRMDGILHDMESPPPRLSAAIVSRIKIIAKLNIAERRLPQDGRIRLAVRGIQVDLRVSIVPIMHGERVVIRILDRQNMPDGLSGIGLDGDILATLGRWLAQPNGIILVTGPTGSGKSTTLYGALQTMDAVQQNIVSVEDPVEYQLENINQIQVKPQIGLTFAHILRSILRQDPDVIMIGEIRDRETAEIAIHAALTGHLVLSTLHTNTAAGAIGRLIDMGIEDYLLTSALTGIMAQRLVRRLCMHCRVPVVPTRSMLEEMGIPADGRHSDLQLYEPAGCAQCSNTGYSGRTSIVELLDVTDSIRRMIVAKASSQELHTEAMRAGMRSMYQSGLEKVMAGVTTIQEVIRATRVS